MVKIRIGPAKGKLGVLLPGLGAVSTTFIAGVMLSRKGLLKPVGSLTQMQTLRLGKRGEAKFPLIKDFVPLAQLSAAGVVVHLWPYKKIDATALALGLVSGVTQSKDGVALKVNGMGSVALSDVKKVM